MTRPMPNNLKQVRELMGDVGYYRNFLPDLSKRTRPLTALLRKGVKYNFTPAMEVIVRQILAELAAPPILVFLDWDAVADGSRPFHVYCEACIDDFGAALEQGQPDGSVRPIAYTSRATLDFERHWTPLGLEARSIVWTIKRLRGYLWGTKFRVFSDHEAIESIGKVGDHNTRVQRWLEFLTAFDYTLEYRTGSANGNAEFLSRLPEPAIEHDRSGSSSLTPVEDGGIFLIRACGLRIRSSPTPGVGLSGLVPRPESPVLNGLPSTSSKYHDSRTRAFLLVRRDSSLVYLLPSPPTITFLARGGVNPPPTPLSLVFVVPSGGDQGPAEAPAAATIVAQRAPLPTSTLQREDSVVVTDPAASAPSLPGKPVPLKVLPPAGLISTRTRRRTAAAAGTAPPAVDYGFGPGGSLDHPPGVLSPRRESHGRDHPHPSLWPQLLPPRRSRRYPSRPTVTVPSTWGLLFYGFGRQLMYRPSPGPTWML